MVGKWNVLSKWSLFRGTCYLLSQRSMNPFSNSLNCVFPTKYGTPKSVKVGHWLSQVNFQGQWTCPFPNHKSRPGAVCDSAASSRYRRRRFFTRMSCLDRGENDEKTMARQNGEQGFWTKAPMFGKYQNKIHLYINLSDWELVGGCNPFETY